MSSTNLAFLDEVQSTIAQLLEQFPEFEGALEPTPVADRDTALRAVEASLGQWNQKLGEIAQTLHEVTQDLERHQSEVRSWSETFAHSRRRAEKLRG